MKKWISMLLLLSVLLLMSACGSPSLKDPGNFYYKRYEQSYGAADSVIRAEQRELKDIRHDIGAVLELYFQGPLDRDLASPFPQNTTVVKWTFVDNTLLLTLSGEFAELSGIDLTIACSCIAKTVMELTPVQRINFQAENALLNGEQSISMSTRNLQLEDDSLQRLASNVTVYYSDKQRRYLVGKEISINLAEDVDVVEYLINQLHNPPRNADLLSPLPDGTKLLNATIENKICKVDFSSEFDHVVWRNAEAQRLSLMSVVNTLTQLPQIDSVEFYSEGNLITQYRLLSIPGPMRWDERAIGPVRNGLNEFDASLYLSNGSNEYLVCVPTRIRQSAGSTKAEMIVRELIGYVESNGFTSPIPKNTGINSVTVEDDVCYIDLDSNFLNSSNMVPLAIRSIITSVCSLPEINQTVITVNGGIPAGDLAPYFEETTVNPDWTLNKPYSEDPSL